MQQSQIEKVKSGKPVFFLLDEIFKGTNSRDRHTGAKVLINEITNFIAINALFENTNEFLLNISKEYREVKNRDYEPNSIYAEF